MARKVRKIASETWQAVEKAVCAGMGYSEAARRFGLRSPHTIIMRARRNHWPVPSRVEDRAKALQRNVTERRIERDAERASNEGVIGVLAESWAEKGEEHRAIAFQMAHTAMKRAAEAPPTIDDWADVERVDKIARKAAGLDEENVISSVNAFQFQFLDERIIPELIGSDKPAHFPEWQG